MPLPLKTVLSLLCCAALLQACAPKPSAPAFRIPEALLTCPAEPAPPSDLRSQRDVALYVIDLRAYGRACEAQLREIQRLQDSQPR